MPTPTTYPYTKSPVATDSLTQAIQANTGITVSLRGVVFNAPNSLAITFNDALPTSPTDQTALLDAVVAAHTGVPLPSTIPTNINGIPQVEVSMRLGNSSSKGMSLATHDFSDRTTWFQKAVNVSSPETLTNSGNQLTFTSAHPYWINLTGTSKAVYGHKQVPKRDGTFGKHADWAAKIYVDAVLQTSGFTVNYAAGTVTFTSVQSGVVTATYWHTDGVTLASEYLLVAPTGKKYQVERVKAYASVGATHPDVTRFEIWATGTPNTYAAYASFADAYYDAGYGQLRYDYRNEMDFAITANTLDVIPKGATMSSDMVIYKYDYVEAFYIDSAKSMTFRMVLLNDLPVANTDRAGAIFYMQLVPS